MEGVFKAHIWGRRKRGDREEVNIKLFNDDDTPLVIPGAVSLPEHSAWLPVSDGDMQNGWTNHASHPLRYRVRASGVVEWQGRLAPGSVGTIFVLPPEARPLDLHDLYNSWRCYAEGSGINASATISISEDSMICHELEDNVDYVNVGCVLYSID